MQSEALSGRSIQRRIEAKQRQPGAKNGKARSIREDNP